MARSRKRLVYTEPELDAKIVERAQDLQIPVNEWMHRVFLHALASKGKVVITSKIEAEI